MTAKPLYRRVLLKASGEALMGEQHFGIDVSVVDRIASDIAEARALGVEVGVVIGGGNIFRGVAVASKGGDRVTGDHMGMLATVINSLALRTSLVKIGVDAVVLSAIAMPELCESFSQRQATAYMNEGKVVIFAGGTGNPFFTTDSAAALRAAEIGADALFKGTQVDGVYSADPKKDPNATRFDRISHAEVIKRGLSIHGHRSDCACARKQHSDNRLFDPRKRRVRRNIAGRWPLHGRCRRMKQAKASRTSPNGPRR